MEFLDIMESLLGDPFNHVLQFRAWCNDPNEMLASAGGNMDAKILSLALGNWHPPKRKEWHMLTAGEYHLKSFFV